MTFIYNTTSSFWKKRTTGSILMSFLSLTTLSLFLCCNTLYAAELDKPANASAGLVNDCLRKESAAASKWDIGGQIRLQYEAKDAGSFPNQDFARDLDHSNDYFMFRTKVHAGWTPIKWFTAYVEGRDAHIVSDVRAAPENDSFDLHQAYFRIGDPKRFPLSLKAGRQELIYGDQRYIGNSDWSNFGRSFDSMKLRYENDFFGLDAFAGRLVLAQNGGFNNANHSDWFSGLYASTRRLASWQETDLFFLASNVGGRSPAEGGQKPRDVYTVGTRWKSLPSKLRGWDYSFEAAGQFGSIPQNGRRLNHRAYAVNATVGHSWKGVFGSPRLGGGYDFGSGDNNPSDHQNGTYQLLFGTNHRFYGNMDLMGLRNMHIPKIEASFKPAKKVTVSAEWLGFWLANTADFFYPESGSGRSQNGYGRNPNYSAHAGQEIDLLVDWRAAAWGQIRAGYGHFFIGDYVRRSINSIPANGGAEGADWVYTQFSFNF
jgi:hypothetical protein